VSYLFVRLDSIGLAFPLSFKAAEPPYGALLLFPFSSATLPYMGLRGAGTFNAKDKLMCRVFQGTF
jgi:hypothetical protein